VNTSAPIGFTNYEPISSTTQPSGNWIKVVYGTTTYWLTNTVKYNFYCTLGNDEATVKKMYGNDYVSINTTYWYAQRSGYRCDELEMECPNVAQAWHVYADDPNAVSWAGSYNVVKITYIEDSEGLLLITRLVKTTTVDWSLKVTSIHAIKFVDGTKKRIKLLLFDKAYVGTVAYGQSNLVRHPAITSILAQTNASYWNGSSWTSIPDPNQQAYNYYSNQYIARGAGTLPFAGTSFGGIMCFRRWGGYHTGSYPIPKIATGYGSLTIFIDYSGSTITEGNAVWGLGEAVIDPSGNLPDISDISPYEYPVSEDNERWSLRYGYPYTISVNAPTSASAGSTVNVQVTTNAPNGKHVYVVDKDNDNILGSATVSNGSATVSFNMPNKNLNIRVYVEGDEPDIYYIPP
jgi:hypothetical protein